MDEYEQVVVERSGQAPLNFPGRLLAEETGSMEAGREQNRWHDLRIWRTRGGAYVVGVEYQTCWEGESNVAWAATTDKGGNLEILLREAESELVGGAVIGYPPSPDYADKQARMLEGLRQRFAERMRRVLAAVPEAAEQID